MTERFVQRRDAYAVRRYRQGFFQRFRFSGEWIDRAGKEGLGISNLDTALTLAIPLGSFENLLLVTPAFQVDYLAGPTDVDVPPRLYNTGVDLMWRKQFNDRWGSMVAVRPAALYVPTASQTVDQPSRRADRGSRPAGQTTHIEISLQQCLQHHTLGHRDVAATHCFALESGKKPTYLDQLSANSVHGLTALIL